MGKGNNGEDSLKEVIHKEKNIQIIRHKKPAKTKPSPDKNKLDESNIAPDGGWGWMVAVTAGISLLSTFPILQSFGILFRQRFTDFGWRSSQIVTLINAQQAATALIGALNGPLYRRFSYLQLSIIGAVLVFLGLSATALVESYLYYFLTITLLYGFGKAFVMSASSMAVNTYFKTKRLTANTIVQTIAGLGPMFFPFLSTFLMVQLGVIGSVLFYAGFSLHTLICAFVYQPVKKHVKKSEGKVLSANLRNLNIEMPLMPQRNDRSRTPENGIDSGNMTEKSEKASDSYTLAISKNNKQLAPEEMKFLEKPQEELTQKDHEENQNVFRRIAVSLDLGLLKDFSYVNLALGLTVVEFTENNFASVLPFILNEFGLNKIAIASAMSILGTSDMIMRFLIPFTVGKLKWDNRVIMIVSTMLICSARVVVGVSRKVPVAMCCFAVMGTNKAIRVAYGNRILPGYVPAKRLPAAIGLERIIMGVFSLFSAPIIGMIPDATSYGFFVLSMNGMCVIVGLMWLLEEICRCCIRAVGNGSSKEDSKTDEK